MEALKTAGAATKTTVEVLAELSAGFKSVPPLKAEAIFIIVPPIEGTVTRVTVALSPTARLPKKQVTVVLETEIEPCDELNETKPRLGGSVSIMVTAGAEFGPRFVTPM